MTERGNIKLPAVEFKKHNDRRQEMGLSWSDYIDGQAPEQPDIEIGDDLREQLDRIESAASTAEERTGTIERKVDELGGR